MNKIFIRASNFTRKVDTYNLESDLLTISSYSPRVSYPRRSGLVAKSKRSRPISTLESYLFWGGGGGPWCVHFNWLEHAKCGALLTLSRGRPTWEHEWGELASNPRLLFNTWIVQLLSQLYESEVVTHDWPPGGRKDFSFLEISCRQFPRIDKIRPSLGLQLFGGLGLAKALNAYRVSNQSPFPLSSIHIAWNLHFNQVVVQSGDMICEQIPSRPFKRSLVLVR